MRRQPWSLRSSSSITATSLARLSVCRLRCCLRCRTRPLTCSSVASSLSLTVTLQIRAWVCLSLGPRQIQIWVPQQLHTRWTSCCFTTRSTRESWRSMSIWFDSGAGMKPTIRRSCSRSFDSASQRTLFLVCASSLAQHQSYSRSFEVHCFANIFATESHRSSSMRLGPCRRPAPLSLQLCQPLSVSFVWAMYSSCRRSRTCKHACGQMGLWHECKHSSNRKTATALDY
mmetsp:Transcript_124074/g.247139  ORF Transcript_124074/g.247139 Transcript_124074/m.247139 type:complete len:229 (+) Transcript_124074:1166-1852(+)